MQMVMTAEMRAERRAKWTWTFIILAFLGGSMSMWIYAAVLAVRDPSFVVVPDYHKKALHWDDYLKEQAANRELGWTVHPIPPTGVDASGKTYVTLFLRDRDGQPLSGGTGEVSTYHHARASEVQEVQLEAQEAGTYRFAVDHFRAGVWHIELSLAKEDVRFSWSESVTFP